MFIELKGAMFYKKILFANTFYVLSSMYTFRIQLQRLSRAWKDGKQWRFAYQATRHCSPGVDSTVHKTHFAMMRGGITSRIVTLRVQLTSFLAMAVLCTK